MKIWFSGRNSAFTTELSDLDPDGKFRSVLREFGHEVYFSRPEVPADALVAWNHHHQALRLASEWGIPRERRILFVTEPRCVRPDMYRPHVFSEYGLVVPASPLRLETVRDVWTHFPQAPKPENQLDLSEFRGRRPTSILIQTNKFSAVPGELYTLRRLVIREAARRGVELHVAGNRWNHGVAANGIQLLRAASQALRWSNRLSFGSWKSFAIRVPDYLGPVADKQRALQGYRTSLVIENEADYVSEKLFDSVAAGAVCIYVGPVLEKLGLPKHLAIQPPAFPSEVIDEISRVVNLPVEEQFRLAQKQQAALREAMEVAAGPVVLERLAGTIAHHLAQYRDT